MSLSILLSLQVWLSLAHLLLKNILIRVCLEEGVQNEYLLYSWNKMKANKNMMLGLANILKAAEVGEIRLSFDSGTMTSIGKDLSVINVVSLTIPKECFYVPGEGQSTMEIDVSELCDALNLKGVRSKGRKGTKGVPVGSNDCGSASDEELALLLGDIRKRKGKVKVS